jgi:hypothetical protein
MKTTAKETTRWVKNPHQSEFFHCPCEQTWFVNTGAFPFGLNGKAPFETIL